MKHTITLLLALIFTCATNAQNIVTREHTDQTGHYLIKYEYDGHGLCYVPATYPPGESHYPATISVFEICYADTVLLSNFEGTFSVGGCCMAAPGSIVQTAKQYRLKKQKQDTIFNKRIFGTDLDGTIYLGDGVIVDTAVYIGSKGAVLTSDGSTTLRYSDDYKSAIISGPVNTSGWPNWEPEDTTPKQITVDEWFEISGYPGVEFCLVQRKKKRK